MRIGLDSASEASEDEGPAMGTRSRSRPLQDLRTPAGKAGVAGGKARPAQATPSNGANTTGLMASLSLSHHGEGSSRGQQQHDREKKEPRPKAEAATMLPPWIKSKTKAGRAKAAPGTEHENSEATSSATTSPPLRRSARIAAIARGHVPTPPRYRSYAPSSPSDSEASSSSSSSVSSDDEDDAPQAAQSEASDSDENASPVGPSRAERRASRGPRASGSSPSKGKDRDTLLSIRLAAQEDEYEGEWADAIRRSGKSWASLAARRSESPFTGPTSPSNGRGQPLKPPRKEEAEDLQSVQSTLSRLKREKEELEQKERRDFEAQDTKLWSSIEGAITAAEESARKRAKEEADRAAAARKTQEEAEKKAKTAREDQEKKAREEKEASEQRTQKEQERKKAEEEKSKAAQQAKEEAAKTKAAMKGFGVGDTLHDESREDYQRWTEKMKYVKEKVLPVIAENSDWRKQCFAAKRQITPKIGQLTNSKAEIWRITSTISSLLKEAQAAPSPNQEIYQWVLNHLSKCLIRQAEQEVAVKVDTAYPLARVVVWLLLDGHEKLGEILMARLVKKSCWCLGYVPEKRPDQDNAAYSKSVGRASPEETSVQFASRQSGIVAFYFAICQTPPTPPPSHPASTSIDVSLVPAHFRPAALWKWQARCVTPPMTSHAIVPALWATLLEVAGPRLLEYYGRQTAKVWELLYAQGIMAGRAGFVKLDEGKAASGRLQLMLEDWKKNGKVETLKGREMQP